MERERALRGAKILAVDDEPDVLETIEEILDVCQVDTAVDYKAALEHLESNSYDVVILDIMGVKGYELLEETRKRGMRTIMLTANALSAEDLVQSIKKGALSYIPKEKIADLATYVTDILTDSKETSVWHSAWFARLRPFFYKQFGSDWRERHSEFVLDVQTVDIILVPTDFSIYSCEAFPWAAFFARRFDAKVIILHVISERDAEDMIKVPGNPWEKVMQREERQMVEDFSSCLIGDFGEQVQKETLVAVGSTPEKIIETARARNASIIVMSTHGRTGLRSLLGSVAEKVTRHAPCPVFSVKPAEMKDIQKLS
jgi:nucleotide-binding universal stress UspA family protein/ActR/RegA family two-component response regulator